MLANVTVAAALMMTGLGVYGCCGGSRPALTLRGLNLYQHGMGICSDEASGWEALQPCCGCCACGYCGSVIVLPTRHGHLQR